MAQIACIVLPTFNEAKNVERLIPKIFDAAKETPSHELHVLVVDDESTDGTEAAVRCLMQTYPRLHVITGKKKGLGEAYKRGMKHAMEEISATLIFEMDADFQHDPALIPKFIAEANRGHTLVIGSRFVAGGGTPDFAFHRLALSRAGNWLIRFLAGLLKIHDCTSGFRCIDADLLRKCDLRFLSTRGYSFQASLLFELLRNGANAVEIPIVFGTRDYGSSKLSFRDQFEFLTNVFRIRFRKSEELIRFYSIGFVGAAVNLGTYFLFTRCLEMSKDFAPLISIELSILANFVLESLWTTGEFHLRFRSYQFLAAMGGALNYAVFLLLIHVFSIPDLTSALASIVAGSTLHYSLKSLQTRKKTPV